MGLDKTNSSIIGCLCKDEFRVNSELVPFTHHQRYSMRIKLGAGTYKVVDSSRLLHKGKGTTGSIKNFLVLQTNGKDYSYIHPKSIQFVKDQKWERTEPPKAKVIFVDEKDGYQKKTPIDQVRYAIERGTSVVEDYAVEEPEIASSESTGSDFLDGNEI